MISWVIIHPCFASCQQIKSPFFFFVFCSRHFTKKHKLVPHFWLNLNILCTITLIILQIFFLLYHRLTQSKPWSHLCQSFSSIFLFLIRWNHLNRDLCNIWSKTVMLLTKLYIVKKKKKKNKWQVVWKATKSPMSSIKICIDSCALLAYYRSPCMNQLVMLASWPIVKSTSRLKMELRSVEFDRSHHWDFRVTANRSSFAVKL